MRAAALERAIGRATARRSEAVERCGVCSAPVAPEHRHLLDEQDGGVLCACRACSLLFERDAAGGDHYRLIPDRRVRLESLSAEVLNVPVGLAFFIRQRDGRVQAHYPSPLGTTESEVRPGAWRTVEEQSPALAAMRPRVEAYLLRATGRAGGEEHWVVPVDDCYRLVAVIRASWTGMSGGSAVWREVARFFEELGRQPGRHGER